MDASRTGHLTESEIVEILLHDLGRVSGAEKAGWNTPAQRAHLLSCPSCGLLRREIGEPLCTLELGATEMSVEEAAEVWDAVRSKAARGAAEVSERSLAGRLRRGLSGAFREIVASLVVEPPSLASAVRGPGAEPAVQVFETEEYAVSLSIASAPQGARIRILGSIAPRGSGDLPPGGRATIYGGTEVIEAEVDELGEFEAEDVPRSDLHVDVEVGTDRIQLSPIHTG